MKFSTRTDSIEQLEAEVLVVGVYRDRLTAAAASVDKACDGIIQRLVETEEFQPDIASLKTLFFPAGIGSRVVILMGLGDSAQCQPGDAFTAAATAARTISESATPARMIRPKDVLLNKSHSPPIETVVTANIARR